jgi:hypothetical protein
VAGVPTLDDLQKAFAVYFDEIERCRQAGAYWALLHVVVALPDICGALESESGWATPDKYVAWCARYCPTDGIVTAEDYKDIRNVVLHQGRSVTGDGRRYYKFTRATASGNSVHRLYYGGDVVVLDVGKLADEVVDGIRGWFVDLQTDATRGAHVAEHLSKLVTVKEQELPGIRGLTFPTTHTSTG